MQLMPSAAFALSRWPKFVICVVLWALIIALVGCASVPSSSDDSKVDFAVQGKLMVFRERQKTALRFAWRQTQGTYQIDVWGSLGQGRVQLRGDAQKMKLLRGDDVIAAGDPQQVMETQLGWSLPVAAIPYWLFGQPLPQQPHTEGTAPAQKGQIQFAQLGWTVRTQLKVGNAANPASRALIPERLNLVRGDIQVRLLVSKFTGKR